MLLDEVYEYYGTWTKLTKEVDIGYSSHRAWMKKGYIPFKMQLLIQHKTKGALQASEEHCQPFEK